MWRQQKPHNIRFCRNSLVFKACGDAGPPTRHSHCFSTLNASNHFLSLPPPRKATPSPLRRPHQPPH
ncbi:hypothetical protein E2C01_001305 [Portunus trituberculatus]|uniref:Uncharacterized protein n=1 Tax=Portunus trituberculatus TaxID=210409 RepID=A0A5B7CIY5_PORTR|nr:hypothetical protein [Portunus trituberculatus]